VSRQIATHTQGKNLLKGFWAQFGNAQLAQFKKSAGILAFVGKSVVL
jgi:hypothetical protein